MTCKKRRRSILAAASLVFLAPRLRAAGESTLRPVEARGVGMAALTVLAQDAEALYWNPAGLARVRGRSIQLSYHALFDTLRQQWIGHVQPLGKNQGWGLSVQTVSLGSIEARDSSGFPDGSLSPRDTSVSGGYGLGGERWSVGMSVKYLKSTLKETASTFSLDAGVRAGPFLKDRVELGLAVRNAGGQLTYEKDSSPLTRVIAPGVACHLKDGWVVALEEEAASKGGAATVLGTEYRMRNPSLGDFFLRAGFHSGRAADLGSGNGLSWGLGWNKKTLSVDYALAPFGDLGSTHLVSMRYSF